MDGVVVNIPPDLEVRYAVRVLEMATTRVFGGKRGFWDDDEGK